MTHMLRTAGRHSSEQFQRLIADNGVVCSMSRSGNRLGQCSDGELLLLAEVQRPSARSGDLTILFAAATARTLAVAI
jgi:hypothetical protein